MIKKQSANKFLDKMNFRKALPILIIFLASISMVSAQTNAENVELFEDAPADDSTISGDDVTFDYGIEEFNTQEGTLELRAETCVASNEVLSTHTPPTSTSSTYTHTESYENCYGQKTWYLFYEGADGSTTDSGIYPSFTIESDASQLLTFSANQPNGDTFEGNVNQEASVDFEVGIESPQDKGDVELVVDGVVVHTWTDVAGGTSQVLTTTETIDAGSHDWNARFVGVDDSQTTTGTNQFEVEDYADRVSLSQTSPTDGESFSSGTSQVTFEYGGSGGGDGDIRLYVDGNLEDTSSWSGDASNGYSTTVSGFDAGSHDWYIEYVGDDGSSTTSGTDSFSIDTEENPTFTLDNPSDGEVFNIDPGQSSTTIDYDGSVETSFSGTLRLYRSGTQVDSKFISSGSNSYTEFSESLSPGNYSYYLEAESDDTGDTYTSSTYDFEIRQTEESAPVFNVGNPDDGDVVTYGEGEGSANVTFSGNTEASYDFTGNITITGNGVNRVQDFVHTSDQTFYEFYESLSAGNYSYQFNVVSEQTGNQYSSSTYDFEVRQTDEVQPELSLDVPTGQRSTRFFNESWEFEANISSEFNGTANLDLVYPTPPDASSSADIHVQNLINDLDVEAGENYTLSALRSLNKDEVLPGTYEFSLILVSDATNNPYSEEKSFSVTREPTWNYVRPNGSTIIVENGESFKETNFEYGMNWVSEGTIRYQVKEPGETSSWETIYSTEVQEDLRTSVVDEFDEVISNINYQEVNNTLVSGNYSARVLYNYPDSGSYSSPVVEFNYQSSRDVLSRIAVWATDTFGEYGTEILATLFILLSVVYVGVITESGSGILLTALAEATTFSIIGWYPGWVAFLMFMFGIGIGYKLFTSEGG